jgi:hypothetical protein
MSPVDTLIRLAKTQMVHANRLDANVGGTRHADMVVENLIQAGKHIKLVHVKSLFVFSHIRARMVCLGIILQRDVLANELALVATSLGAPLLGYDNGIILTQGGHRDVRIRGMDVPKRKADGSDGVWLVHQPGIPEYPIELDFRCRGANAVPFTVSELQRVLDVVCAQFGAEPAVVLNRHALGGVHGPTSTDTAADINIFYGFDVAQAVDRFTLPSTAWPDDEEERVFTCWRCSRQEPAAEFHTSGYGYDTDPFYHLLANRVLGESNRCCRRCTAQLTEAPRM